MAIEKKLIHFGKLADFETQLNAGNILDYSIVFIQDAKKIYNRGTYYDCNGGDASNDDVYISTVTLEALTAMNSAGTVINDSNLYDAIVENKNIWFPYEDASGYAKTIGVLSSTNTNLIISSRNGFVNVMVSLSVPNVYYILKNYFDIASADKQDTLVSGTNIKTINGETLLGSGDITIEGGSGEENVQSDWNVTDTTSDAYIKNKPTFATVATSGSYNDLADKPTIPSAVTVDTALSTTSTNPAQNKVVTAGINAKYTKPSTGIPKSDLDSDVQTSLGKADTALQSETYTGTITGITMNGTSKGTSGVVDLGTVITAHQDISGKQDKLVSGTNIRTINGESILGSGDIVIEGGETLTESDIAAMGFTKNIGTITGFAINGTTTGVSGGTAYLPNASTSAYGVTKLSSSTSSTSTALAATSSAVKAAYDLANSKQATLVSGTNIKTINGTSLLGSGNISISSGVTEDYVNEAIASAITTTLNTAV